MSISEEANQTNFPFHLPNLPYGQRDLEPHISEKTLSFHYGKHHNAYVTNLNKLIEETEFSNMSLEEIMKSAYGDTSKAGIFNNAAQIWNHTFYWHSMKKPSGNDNISNIPNRVFKMIIESFQSVENFLQEFSKSAATQFGSGWAWLVFDGNKLSIEKTGNADNPFLKNKTPLLTIDVWEHAYYLDYQNKRPGYIEAFTKSLINWEFIEKNME